MSRGASAADVGATVGDVATMAPTAEGLLKSGMLDRLLEDNTWHPSTVILDEDRLWYSQAPSGEKDGTGRYGGGMVFLPLRECDRVVEGDDKKLLQLLTKGGTMTLRARNSNEKTAWLLAVVKQAAFIKERDILLQAELIISGMEFRRATQQVARLEVFNKLPGVLSTREARELLLDFARCEWEDANKAAPASLESFINLESNAGSAVPSDEASAGAEVIPDRAQSSAQSSVGSPLRSQGGYPAQRLPGPSLGDLPAAAAAGSDVRWPKNLSLKAVAECLERRASIPIAEMEPASQEVDREAWVFVEETLFPRFLEHPEVQCRMCWIAAGIT